MDKNFRSCFLLRPFLGNTNDKYRKCFEMQER